MVDEDIEIDGIISDGNVITFTSSEAIKYGYCEAEVNSVEELLSHAGIGNYDITQFDLSLSEKIIFFFYSPIIQFILILSALSIMIGGLIYGTFALLRKIFDKPKKLTM